MNSRARRGWVWTTALAVAAAGALAGCKAGGPGGAGDRPLVAVDLAPNHLDYAVTKVAVLAYANPTGLKEAAAMTRYVDAALLSSGKYQFTKIRSFERDAQRSGAADEHARLLEVWDKRRTLNKTDVVKLCEATGYDALVAYEISNWKQEKIDVTQEGTSNTTVGLKMEMWAKDGTLLWAASSQKVAHSQPYIPSLNVKATQSGEAVYNESMVPLPPPIEPIAQEVAEEVVATLPELTGEPAAPAASAPTGGGW